MLLSGRFSMRKLKTNKGNLPLHIAIIPDGNGRWANRRGMPRSVGHREGSRVLRDVVLYCSEIGIKYVTLYAFSTENWKRPKDEVNALMKLLSNYLDTSIKTSQKNNMRVKIIGDIKGLSEEIQEKIIKLEEASKNNTGLNFQVAINYGSRDEIIRAVKALSEDLNAKTITIDDIDENLFSSYLDTADIPDPDLLIRTSGEQRLSNYLLWQLAYTEFYFTDVLWPDFNIDELKRAIEFYSGRKRNFGAIGG